MTKAIAIKILLGYLRFLEYQEMTWRDYAEEYPTSFFGENALSLSQITKSEIGIIQNVLDELKPNKVNKKTKKKTSGFNGLKV